MAFDPAAHGLAFCNSVPLKADGSQAGDVSPSPSALETCSLDSDAADALEARDATRRRTIIMEAISEWRRLGPGMLRQNPKWSWRNWTNACLTQEGFSPLTAAEVKEYDNGA
jgi:hypothetical protein